MKKLFDVVILILTVISMITVFAVIIITIIIILAKKANSEDKKPPSQLNRQAILSHLSHSRLFNIIFILLLFSSQVSFLLSKGNGSSAPGKKARKRPHLCHRVSPQALLLEPLVEVFKPQQAPKSFFSYFNLVFFLCAFVVHCVYLCFCLFETTSRKGKSFGLCFVFSCIQF